MKKALYSLLFISIVLPITGCKVSGKSNSKSIEEIWKSQITNYKVMDIDSNVTITATNEQTTFITEVDNGKYKCTSNGYIDYLEYVSGTDPTHYTFNNYSIDTGYQKQQIQCSIYDLIDYCGIAPVPYENVTYDKANDQYTANQVTMTIDDWTFTIADLVVKFTKDKFTYMSYKQVYSETQEKGEACVIQLSNYGSPKVTLPN